MTNIKIMAAAMAIAFAAPGMADSLAKPVMDIEIIVEDTGTASSGTNFIPRIIFTLLVALATSG